MAVAVPESVEGWTEALAEAPYEELADAFSQLRALECAVRAAALGLLPLIAQHDDEMWNDGGPKLVDWITLRCGITRGEANELMEVAEALPSLPHISAAFSSGRLSWRRLCLLVKFVTPEEDEHYAEEAGDYSLAALQALARAKNDVSDKDVKDAFEKRSLTWIAFKDHYRFMGNLPLDLGAVAAKAIERLADQADCNSETGYTNRAQRQCDAFCQLASAQLASDVDADRATIVIETDMDALINGGVAELEADAVIPSGTLQRLLCDCRYQMATVKDGASLGIGRMNRSIPRWLWRRIKKRDRGCRFPGCTRTRWVNGHHIKEWKLDLGPTDMDNLLTLCQIHHHYVHEAGWRIEGNPETTVRFISPDGRCLDSMCPELRPEVWQRAAEMLAAPAAEPEAVEFGWRAKLPVGPEQPLREPSPPPPRPGVIISDDWADAG